MTYHRTRCKACNVELKGFGYEMPGISEEHIKICHNDDYVILMKLKKGDG